MKKQFLSLVFMFMFMFALISVYYASLSFACMNKQAKNIKCADTSQTTCPYGVSEAVCESKFDRTKPVNLPLDYEDATGEKLVGVEVQNEADGLYCYNDADCKYYSIGQCVHKAIRTGVYAMEWWTTKPCD